MTTVSFAKKDAPQWLLSFWREIDDKTFGDGFNCLTEGATCNLGVADWKGRDTIRENLRAFIDTGFTALHDVTEYWDGGSLKVFRGTVTMTPDDQTQPVVKPVMTHFFYMDEVEPTKVRHWYGSVGPIAF
ncbi:nuclear transport factor 2 family protein [Rhizobium sp. RCC_161_2]|uniref:nuclear transport factor 2 family protein n=1 Tax=Rhizobium sp. RCC_161_2 TaxID=3239219 RepID=UPI003525363C